MPLGDIVFADEVGAINGVVGIQLDVDVVLPQHGPVGNGVAGEIDGLVGVFDDKLYVEAGDRLAEDALKEPYPIGRNPTLGRGGKEDTLGHGIGVAG